MTYDELFLCTVEDLESRLRRAKPARAHTARQQYEMLMVSSLLRKLILDRGSLVSLVNRTRRILLRYKVAGWPYLSGTGTGRVYVRSRFEAGALPAIPPEELSAYFREVLREKDLTLDQMLATPLAIYNEVAFTAKGVIRYAANLGGGVHVGGEPRNEMEEALQRFGGDIWVNGYSMAVAGLWDIGEVVVAGLEPLRFAVGSTR